MRALPSLPGSAEGFVIIPARHGKSTDGTCDLSTDDADGEGLVITVLRCSSNRNLPTHQSDTARGGKHGPYIARCVEMNRRIDPESTTACQAGGRLQKERCHFPPHTLSPPPKAKAKAQAIGAMVWAKRAIDSQKEN